MLSRNVYNFPGHSTLHFALLMMFFPNPILRLSHNCSNRPFHPKNRTKLCFLYWFIKMELGCIEEILHGRENI